MIPLLLLVKSLEYNYLYLHVFSVTPRINLVRALSVTLFKGSPFRSTEKIVERTPRPSIGARKRCKVSN